MSGPKKRRQLPWGRQRLGAGLKPVERKVPLAGRLAQGWAAWFRAKNPVLRFVVVFGVLAGLFYAALLSPSSQRAVLAPFLRLNARMAGPVCNWFGRGASVTGESITSGQFAIRVGVGCDASEPLALFVAAVLAFPAPFRRKIPGILLGTVILLAVNLARIVSLFLTGIYYPGAFEGMHREWWPAAFILLAIVLLALWIQWAMKPRPAVAHVAN